MENYQKMYLLLFNAITDSIESIEKTEYRQCKRKAHASTASSRRTVYARRVKNSRPSDGSFFLFP